MRRVLAVICSLITLFALKETINIFTTSDPEIVKQRSILIVIALSISIPLVILSLWLWKPKYKGEEQSD
ncbi:hypothetical protein [Pedobacter sandarakinus]|uniref:hypothetical protein n=1 Tax=Pedobacter sandarakinus TaxID=353156 RepID=UPI002246A374|nr:hypothetical protein [Pedobacter sandarakinus]MCX2574604.1 hypothetical protein [Pedobacter sandarakinus]